MNTMDSSSSTSRRRVPKRAFHLLGSEDRCGLVQDEQFHLAVKGLDYLHPLLLAHGQLPDPGIGSISNP